jgi:hypothetical protein
MPESNTPAPSSADAAPAPEEKKTILDLFRN